MLQVSTKNPYKQPKVLKALVNEDTDGQQAADELASDMEVLRPRIRADCLPGGINEQRPCPWYGCEAHLGLDINETTGSMMVRDLDTMVHTCVLDVAELGGVTLEEIGEIMDLTRERIRQVEVRGIMAVKPIMVRFGVAPEDWKRAFNVIRRARQRDNSED